MQLGLSFIPTVRKIHIDTVKTSLARLTRSVKLKDYFRDDNNPFKKTFDRMFIEKSEWTPPDERLSKEATESIEKLHAVSNEVINRYPFKDDHLLIRNARYNITRPQQQAINRLRNNPDIVIKQADKGGLTCIMNRTAYITEAYRQLNNPKYYQRISTPRRIEIIPQINAILTNMLKEGYISDGQFDFLQAKPTDKTRYFHLLPKVHKEFAKWPQKNMPEGRPIVGDCETESRRISDLIDYYIKPISTSHPSYVKDTYDFVSRIRNRRVEPSWLLVTGDVTALYTNMQINRTIAVTKRALANNPQAKRPDKYLIELLEIALRNNDFIFNEEIFLQIHGTAMGKSFAPSLANLYLVDFDRRATTGFRIRPHFYFRFLDDVFFLWPGTREELKEFELFLNSVIPDITITLKAHEKEIDFLDTTVFKHPSTDATTLQTRTYFKSTDTHQLLHVSSFHPPHTCQGILKSQLLRFKRLSSFKTDFDQACRTLFRVLRRRGYNDRMLRRTKLETWNGIHGLRRTATPIPILPMVIPYSPLSTQLTRGWRDSLAPSPLFTNHRIIAAYSKHRNLAQRITSSKLRPARESTAN